MTYKVPCLSDGISMIGTQWLVSLWLLSCNVVVVVDDDVIPVAAGGGGNITALFLRNVDVQPVWLVDVVTTWSGAIKPDADIIIQ